MTDNESIIIRDLLAGEGCPIESKAELQELIDLFVGLRQARTAYSASDAERLALARAWYVDWRDVRSGVELYGVTHVYTPYGQFSLAELGEQLAVHHAPSVHDGDGLNVDDS